MRTRGDNPRGAFCTIALYFYIRWTLFHMHNYGRVKRVYFVAKWRRRVRTIIIFEFCLYERKQSCFFHCSAENHIHFYINHVAENRTGGLQKFMHIPFCSCENNHQTKFLFLFAFKRTREKQQIIKILVAHTAPHNIAINCPHLYEWYRHHLSCFFAFLVSLFGNLVSFLSLFLRHLCIIVMDFVVHILPNII